MSKTLQIVELMLATMEKEPNRYRLEITSKGLLVSDRKEFNEKKREIPEYFTYFYIPTEGYQPECNRMFNEFIGGLKA